MKRIFAVFIPLLLCSACSDNYPTSEVALSLMRPCIIIQTEESSLSSISKEGYVKGSLEVASKNSEECMSGNLKIRGRGNSTWLFSKKPYQIKFSEKESVLGMSEGKRWVLLANYTDKTMLRNEVAFDLSRLSDLDWRPESRFAEVFINDEYLGVYQITQKVEESSNRVKIGDDGYLLEVNQPSRLGPGDVSFRTENHLFEIKEPCVRVGDSKYDIVKDYVQLAENVLFGDSFHHPEKGYAKYIDVESFIDWYLINEITKNNDAIFYSSVYLTYVPGGKLKMGPVWDFDISLGNINYNGNDSTGGLWVKNSDWISRLFEDPVFVDKVKSRFQYFYSNRDVIQEKIDSNRLAMRDAQERNFEVWPILGTYVWPNNVVYDTYDEEVEYLKKWLDERLEWMKATFDDR